MKTFFSGARLFDPSLGLDQLGGALVENGKILEICESGRVPSADQKVDLGGRLLTPGFIDVHVHLREPGEEHKENIQSGSQAAAAGGYTTVCLMANTKPVNDGPMITRRIVDRAREVSKVRVHPIGSISRNLEGREMSEYWGMLREGVVGFSDDGRGVMDSLLARKAMEYIKDLGVPYIEHCEDHRLSEGGVMHEGATSFDMGLKGIPHCAEDVMAVRDICLSRQTGVRLHLAHVSSRHTVQYIAHAKKEGLAVTGEVTPHHLTLTDASVRSWDSDFRMAPPLRLEEDRKALVQALEDGVLDCIATDHAPHAEGDKRVDFCCAANGVIGLETALPVVLSLVHRGELSLGRAIEALTAGPARVMGFSDRGVLRPGACADFAVVNLEREWVIDKEKFFSRSRNCPFHGWKVKGAVEATYVAGEKVFVRGEA